MVKIIKRNSGGEKMHLKRHFLTILLLPLLTSNAFSAPKVMSHFMLKTHKEIPNSNGAIMTVASHTDNIGIKTKIQNSTVTVLIPFTPPDTLVNNVDVPVYTVKGDKMVASSTINTSLRYKKNKYKKASLYLSLVVNEPYHGLASGKNISLTMDLSLTDASGAPFLNKFVTSECAKYIQSNSKNRQSQRVIEVISSPIDMVMVQSSGKPVIVPLFYNAGCIINNRTNEVKRNNLYSEKLVPKLGAKDLPYDKGISASSLFSAKRVITTAYDTKNKKPMPLFEIPSNLLREIKKTYLDIIAMHEAEFMDGKGTRTRKSSPYL